MCSKAVGIDLGTTFSCVSVWENSRPEVITNDQGNRTTPSVIGFTKGEKLVGEAALVQQTRNLENTIYDVKRFIGRSFSDPSVQEDLKTWPFSVTDEEEGLRISVRDEKYSPEDLSALILNKMKETAEAYIGEQILDAVITVPAYFNGAQRRATRIAGQKAGLNVLQLVPEPTAAAIAYGLHRKSDQARTILIYDLGGGTFDVSVLINVGYTFQVKAVGGNSHLGGEDFDQALLDHLLLDFAQQYPEEPSLGDKAKRRLRVAAERAKRVLSSAQQTLVEVDALRESIDYATTVTRAQFEALIKPFLERTLVTLQETLKDANVDKSVVDEIILIGGSTRIPLIRQMISDYFDGKLPNRSINPDEAVANGAAIVAAQLVGDIPKIELLLKDVTPLTLGFRSRGGLMMPVIHRNTTIPCRHSVDCKTAEDDQPQISFRVYEGERPLVKDNWLIGKFSITDIPPGPSGSQRFNLTFELDADGILTVTATCKSTGATKSIQVADHAYLARSQVEKVLLEAELNKERDALQAEQITAWVQLDEYVYRVREKVNRLQDEKLNEEELALLQDAIQKEMLWLEQNRNSASKEEIEKRHTAWKKLIEHTLRL